MLLLIKMKEYKFYGSKYAVLCKELFYLLKGRNRISTRFFKSVRQSLRVEPTAIQAGIDGSLDVRSEGIAYNKSAFSVPVRDIFCHIIEKCGLRFLAAHFLRNENIAEISVKTSLRKTAALISCGAVCNNVQSVGFAQFTAKLLRAVKQNGAAANVLEILLIEGGRVAADTDFLEEVSEALHQERGTVNFTALKAFPVAVIDSAVQSNRFLRTREAELLQGLFQTVIFGSFEVEQCHVCVKKDGFVLHR